MVWHYILVFLGALLVDVVPFPLPPAFTIMMILQICFKLNVWVVIVVGVAGSIAGRYILSLYIPKVSGKLFKPSKNEDVQYLGRRLKQKSWKSHALILVYSLMPLPTTPLFIAGGMAKLKTWQILPAFIVGKLISDTIAVLIGRDALGTTEQLMDGMVSWKSIGGLALGLALLFALIFFDWRSLLQKKHFRLKFHVWR